MSRAPERRATRAGSPTGSADGFTLVEIIVALGIVTVVMLALLPQLVVGIRSTGVAREIAQTKGIAQGEIERIRNLPFHISPDAGPYVDVLDRYYPDRTTVPSSFDCTSQGRAVPPPGGASGFVASTSGRCDYEPATGAFFRIVKSEAATAHEGAHTIVVDTQFLSDTTPPAVVTPGSGYDSQTTGKDNPPASQIGVTITVFAAAQPTRRPVTIYTQVASQPPPSTLLSGSMGVRALEIGTVTLTGAGERAPLSLAAGLLTIGGSVSTTSTVSVNRGAVAPVLADGTAPATPYGLSSVQVAPPTISTTAATTGAAALPQGCAYACWGGAALNAASLSAAAGLPNAGSVTAPVRSELSGVHSGTQALAFGNATDAAQYDPSLGLTGNLVQLDTSAARSAAVVTPCVAPGTSWVSGTGYLTSTASGVTACASASTGALKLFPTASAPQGVVQLELVTASASCHVSGTGHTASAAFDYDVRVRYWDNTVAHYVSVGPITKATGSDVLAEIDLDTVAVGGGKKLGDYISSWSSLTADRVKQKTVGGIADLNMPGAVTISTQPTRTDAALPAGDTPSVVSLAVGALSCHAEDLR